MNKRTLKLAMRFMLSFVLAFAGLLVPVSAMPDAQTFTDNVTMPISGTVFDCSGNAVTLSGTVHILSHITISDSGQFVSKFQINQNLQGTSATGSKYVMNQHVTEILTGEVAGDGFPTTQTFEIHSNLNNNDPNVPQFHLKAIFHVTFNANGEITGTQLLIKEECQGS